MVNVSQSARPLKSLEIWHNILWSKYKGAVLSEAAFIAAEQNISLMVYQIAETDSNRVSLSSVDLSVHQYPYELLFKSSYDQIPLLSRITSCALRCWKSDADLVILAGYDKIEYWAQAIILWMRGKDRAVFCDSTLYDNPQRFTRYIAKYIFFKMVPASFCYGERAREYLLFHGMDRKSIFYRCQAAYLPKGYDAAAIPDRRRLAQAQNERPRILYVGRLSEEKNLFALVSAFVAARQSLDCELVFVGAGPLAGALEQMVKDEGIAGSVIFCGSLAGDDLYLEYLRATVLALPSASEPWGLVVNEALSHGCPAVVSRQCGCVPELIVAGRTGLACDFDDVDQLARNLVAMLVRVAQFPDEVVGDCLQQISAFTPAHAGAEIIAGAMAIRAQ